MQDTVLQSLHRLPHFEYRQEGALQAYFRQAVLNRIRTQFRQAYRRPPPSSVTDSFRDDAASPLEEAIGTEVLQRYEDALARLSGADRELVIAKVEMGYGNRELATMFGKPSEDAARKAAARAVLRLAEDMGRAEKT